MGLFLAAAAILAPAPALAAGLGEAQVRAFVAEQQRNWNAGAIDAWAAGFRPDATFTDQYRTPAGQVVPYGTSTLSQARAQSRKFRASSKISETGEIVSIAIAHDGRTAQAISRVVTRTEGPKGLKVSCVERRQELVAGANGVRSKGQTDTFSRCRR